MVRQQLITQMHSRDTHKHSGHGSQTSQKEYSTEPMLSQVNTLMSHVASQRTYL